MMMVEISVWPKERRDVYQNDLSAAIANAINAGVSDELATLLRSARPLGFELTNILSGNPRANATRLSNLVDRLDGMAGELKLASEQLHDSSPRESFLIFQVARIVSDLTFWVHCPDPVDSQGGAAADDPTKPMADGPHAPNLFCWRGTRIELQPKPWAMMNCLWNAANRTASESILAEAIYANERTGLNETGTIKSVADNLNRQLNNANLGVSVSKKRLFYTLVLPSPKNSK